MDDLRKLDAEYGDDNKTLLKLWAKFLDKKKKLDIILDEILQAAEKEKLAKSIVKKFATHIIVGIPGGDSVTEYKYGKPAILLSTISTVKIQADINTIKANLKDGQVILNTNLQALGIVI